MAELEPPGWLATRPPSVRREERRTLRRSLRPPPDEWPQCYAPAGGTSITALFRASGATETDGVRLSRLILERKEEILRDFEDFARTHTEPGASMDVVALRDHAAGMLEAFARDLESPQTSAEQERKSKGGAPLRHIASTAAQEHGIARAQSGFSLVEAVAEYRALRASVLRHWTAAKSDAPQSEVEDLIRFNEALDQAIAESIDEYSKVLRGYREIFLAILGHDLRSPLHAIMNASGFLAEHTQLDERDERLVHLIQRSGERMKDLVDDMIDFTSSQLGHGIPLQPRAADLGDIVSGAVQEIQMTHPGREFRLVSGEELTGEWDARRIREAITNLLDNAVNHGVPETVITTTVSGMSDADDLIVAVHNLGPAIPPGEQKQIFDPFKRGSSKQLDADEPARGIGLGLYIARQIVEAHGGTLTVESAADKGTTFSMRLPRRLPHQPGDALTPESSHAAPDRG
jgi:signal transduction histidine kinase